MSRAFARELKDWRGTQPQKSVHQIFDVPLGTYQSWEAGGNHNRTPHKLALEEIRRRMSRWKFEKRKI